MSIHIYPYYWKEKTTIRRDQSNKENFSDTKIFHFHNDFHYGDNILNLKFFYNIHPYLKKNNITIYYYYNDSYIRHVVELERYVNKETLQLRTSRDKPTDSYTLWMGETKNGAGHGTVPFDVYYDLFYKDIIRVLGLTEPISTSLYQPEDYLEGIYRQLPAVYHNIDVLILNNVPMSGQCDSCKDIFDSVCVSLNKKFKNVVCLEPILDNKIQTTREHGLTLQDIGAISTHATYILAINSGPLIPCLNLATKNHVKHWVIIWYQPFNDIPCTTMTTANKEVIESIFV